MLKKLLSLCVVLALVAGFSCEAFAQAASPQGVRVRIVSPDSGSYAGIDGTVKVNVLLTKVFTSALDTVIVALRGDTLAPTGVSTLTISSFSADSLGISTGRFVDTIIANGTGYVAGSAVDTFKFTFTVQAGDSETNADAIFATAYVSASGNTGLKKLNNLSATKVSTLSDADAVGDGKKVGIDGIRPVNGTTFDSTLVDTSVLSTTVFGTRATAAGAANSIQVIKSAKEGDLVKVRLNVKNIGSANAKEARVYMLRVNNDGTSNATTTVPDSSLNTSIFTIDALVNLAGAMRDSFTLSSSFFLGGIEKNNMRLKAVGFLVDNAGNLSAEAATSASAVGFSQDILYVFDAKAPKITLTHPDSTTERFTGRIDTTFTGTSELRKGDGTQLSQAHVLNPLNFAVDEGTTVRWAIVEDDTASFSGTASTSAIKVSTTDAFDASKGDAGGDDVGLSVVVKDSVGNKTTKSVAGVFHDQVATTVTNLFPASESLPEDKINNVTRHPIFRINEVVDSISVRFVQTSGTPRDTIAQSVSASKLTVVGEDIQMTVQDTLLDDEEYFFQLFIKDLAGNITITPEDTLTFDKDFQNPEADSFTVVAAGDSVLAGQALKLTVTAIDSKLTRQAGATRKAVTYGKNGVLVRADAGDQDVKKISYWGTGVTDNGDGTANLNGEGWVVGERDFWMLSTLTLNDIIIVGEDTSTTIVDGEATKVVNFRGEVASAKKIAVVAADFRLYAVKAWEGGEEATNVQGDFTLTVLPTDIWGNPSTKVFEGATSKGSDSLNLLDSRLLKGDSKNWLEEIFVTISANDGGARVPSGPQAVSTGNAATGFTVVAPNRTGEGLEISVRTANASGDTSNILAGTPETRGQNKAHGKVTLAFTALGEDVPDPSGDEELAAPANLVVQDYKGADGEGDQGGFILASFPRSAGAASYQLFRELDVTTGLDDEGNVVVMEVAMAKWVPWASLGDVHGDEVMRAVIPTLDNVATRWAIAAVKNRNQSDRVPAGKRVFTKESVQRMAQFLGIDPNRIVDPEELGDLFQPSAEYVKSILGDQKNLLFAALDPDVSSLFEGQVPQTIRTGGAKVVTSAQTLAEGAVRAVDNIPPAAVAEEGAGVDGNIVTWEPSSDDKIVGFMHYRGYAVPIDGVTQYEILGGDSEDGEFDLIATLPKGSAGFEAEELPGWVRIDALDLDNRTLGPVLQAVALGRPTWVDAEGKPVFIIRADGATPNVEDFEDFIAFAGAFNANLGDANFVPNADTNDDGTVNFGDFIAFAGAFNRTAVSINGQPVPSTKPVLLPPGVNDNSEMSLRLGSEQVLPGQIISLDVSLANITAVEGFGFVLNYDASKFEFVEALEADQDLLKTTGGETPLFRNWADTPGEVIIANAVINGTSVTGGGDLVRLTFKVLREFEDAARFEIAQGIVFDPERLSNPVVTQGVLNVESTPTEFALFQNFPNPFNPETTIKYNLSESADVTVQIYNVVGQVVRSLVAERQSAGRYQVQWSGKDDRGVTVSSGIYFYQISAGKFHDVRKLMLLK
jgi:hypothetical protein